MPGESAEEASGGGDGKVPPSPRELHCMFTLPRVGAPCEQEPDQENAVRGGDCDGKSAMTNANSRAQKRAAMWKVGPKEPETEPPGTLADTAHGGAEYRPTARAGGASCLRCRGFSRRALPKAPATYDAYCCNSAVATRRRVVLGRVQE